ncbi:MAG: hypothetical protein HYV35_02570 [Lentisphaerae bacterium]|nr:hypothetical protein [Lentisphaerota bacterium]
MSGVQFVVDDHGRKTAVVIDLRKNRNIWEDFYDRLLVQERAHEPREHLAEVKKLLRRQDKLRATI